MAQWNEEHPDDQLVLNKAGFAVRKPKSRVDLEKKAQREAKRAEEKRKKAKRCDSFAVAISCVSLMHLCNSLMLDFECMIYRACLITKESQEV